MSSATVGMLSVREAAEGRRSIRVFEPEPIPRQDLEEVLDVARRAPSAFNVQPWRFVVVESAELRARLGEAAYTQPQVTSAPAVIVLYTDMEDALENIDEVLHPSMSAEQRTRGRRGILGSFESKSPEERDAWGAEQGNIALGYLLLAAEAHGYRTSPMLGFKPEEVKEILGLPRHVRIPALVAIGRGAEAGYPQHRHPVERIARAA